VAGQLRIATFNVENLFSRAKLLNFQNNADGSPLLSKVEQLRRELAKDKYDPEKIMQLYRTLKSYIEIVETRGHLLNREKKKVVASGVDAWNGLIRFKRDAFSDTAVKNTARVIREVNADILCLVEVESRPTLKQFCSDRLPGTAGFERYPYHMVIDGNDDRGIDVGVVSRLPIGRMRSHIYDRGEDGREVFSRDCLEIEIIHPKGFSVWLLLNHFKSKGYGVAETSDAKRERQARQVLKILGNYKLGRDRVVLLGDLNDTPDSKPLRPLMETENLRDVLTEKVKKRTERWTYHYKENQQIDYMLVSEPIRKALVAAGVERRGIYGVEKFSEGSINPFASVKHYTDSASDHGAIWADFEL